MKRRFIKGLLVCVLALSLGDWGGGVAPAAAQAGGCPGAIQLKGAYGLDLQGRNLQGSSTTAGQPPYVAVGVLRLYAGRFSLDLTRSVDGVVSHDSFDGSTSGKDCNLTLTSADTSFSLRGQIAESGKTVLMAGIDASGGNSVVVSGKMRKIGFYRCDDSTLRGNYVYISQGYDRPDPSSAITVLAKTGQEIFHGNGCSYYRETITTSAQVVEVGPTYLAYQVNPDCSFDLIQDDTPVFYGVLGRQGTQRAIHEACRRRYPQWRIYQRPTESTHTGRLRSIATD